MIAAVGSLASAINAGLRANARAILGGDIEIRRLYEPLPQEIEKDLQQVGSIAKTREMRSMATRGLGNDADADRLLVELKGVDSHYPLYGELSLEGENGPQSQNRTGLLQSSPEGIWGAFVDASLAERWQLNSGDRITIGGHSYQIRGILRQEPDRAVGLFVLGPRVMVANESLADTDLIQPGSLIYHHYLMKTEPDVDAAAYAQQLKARYPDRDWRVRLFDDAAPQIANFVDRLAMFLNLVGLTALLIGGLGIGQAVQSFLESRTRSIAIFKYLGASGRFVYWLYAVIVLVMAAMGIVIAIGLGAMAPLIAAGPVGDRFGLSVPPGPFPAPLMMAAGFGFLVTMGFSAFSLARARDVAPSGLLRNASLPLGQRIRLSDYGILAFILMAALGLTLLLIDQWLMAVSFVAAAAVSFLMFALLAKAVKLGALWLIGKDGRRARIRNSALRLALANLTRPGAPTQNILVALGLGLTLLVTIGLIQDNFSRELQENIPEKAPSFFFIDVQPSQREQFLETLKAIPGTQDYEDVPMLRGRILALNGVPAEQIPTTADNEWVLRGDRGITWSRTPPKGAILTEGEWWPVDYSGEDLLVSFDQEIAESFGLRIGDSVTLTVVGRKIEAKIANFREIDWQGLDINFVMVFSPGILEQAPQNYLATIRVPMEQEGALQKLVNRKFPNVSVVRVRDALMAANRMLSLVAAAVSAIAFFTLINGIAVLGGAMLANYRNRVKDAVILKVLGASRAYMARLYLYEQGLLGVIAASIALPLGGLGAYLFVISFTESRNFEFSLPFAGFIVLISVLITLAAGFAGAFRALGQKPLPILRND